MLVRQQGIWRISELHVRCTWESPRCPGGAWAYPCLDNSYYELATVPCISEAAGGGALQYWTSFAATRPCVRAGTCVARGIEAYYVYLLYPLNVGAQPVRDGAFIPSDIVSTPAVAASNHQAGGYANWYIVNWVAAAV
jgi:hypothetical protein